MHAGEIIHVYNGELTLASGDDAIHCDGDVYFDNVNLSITDCYEGIEGAYIEINGGKYHIIAEDDGINATGEASMSALQEGDDMPPDDGQGNQNMEAPPAIPENETEITKTAFVFNDGDLYIEGGGDGIDINGSAEVNGGSVETYCMKDGPEEAFDFDGELYINGGVVFGAGNANMFKLPNEHSKAKNLVCYMDQTYRNGGELVIEDSSGEVIEHHELTGSLGIVIAYGDKIKSGETYTVKMNEKMLGTATIQGTNTVIKPGVGHRQLREQPEEALPADLLLWERMADLLNRLPMAPADRVVRLMNPEEHHLTNRTVNSLELNRQYRMFKRQVMKMH